MVDLYFDFDSEAPKKDDVSPSERTNHTMEKLEEEQESWERVRTAGYKGIFHL